MDLNGDLRSGNDQRFNEIQIFHLSCQRKSLFNHIETKTNSRRISEQTFGPASNAYLTRFLFLAPTTSQSGFHSHSLSPWHQCKYTSLSSPLSLPSLPLSGASLHQVLNAPSRSRTSAIPFLVTEVSRIVWTVSSSWDFSHTCTTTVSSPYTKSLSEV